uniref:Trafficking protein particle complex subunit n=1 Tax=Alexandrium catenella TaxID=2925 RepID=A0A7S1SEB8_ALECA|mmetsp:Transcript_95265/g.253043  ORF Transcript_95265/g.253043 Transcript_95265/m.253043 type:complete len:183 (+) Transcript_95265:126-674(+)
MLDPQEPQREVSESALLLLNAEMAQSLRRSVGFEAALVQLNMVGFTTGMRLATRLTASRFPILAERIAMKYLCKEVWAFLFRKSVDRLQTDRRGNYHIHDARFRWLEQLSPPPDGGRRSAGAGDAELHEAANLHLALPCGIIRGVLMAVGIDTTVTPEFATSTLPACTFTVTLKREESPSPP